MFPLKSNALTSGETVLGGYHVTQHIKRICCKTRSFVWHFQAYVSMHLVYLFQFISLLHSWHFIFDAKSVLSFIHLMSRVWSSPMRGINISWYLDLAILTLFLSNILWNEENELDKNTGNSSLNSIVDAKFWIHS